MSHTAVGKAENFAWIKSSHSGTGGGNCVEVAATWTKSSHSGSSLGDCVEVAAASRVCVHVRDSKRPALATLAFPAAQWAALTSPLRRRHA